MKILHIDSSILEDNSASRAISSAIVDGFRASGAPIEVTYRDLGANPLPHLTLERLSSDEGAAVLKEFLDATVVVIGAPMYNFGIASQLKAWFDHILVAGQTFRYEPDGVIGLAGDKQVIVAHSRGGIYADGTPGAANEHAESHLRVILGFIGVTNPEFVTAEGVAMGDEPRANAMSAALGRIDTVIPNLLVSAA